MHFLPDVFVECEVCGGKRYNRETLEVTYRGKSIADVLGMTVEARASSSRITRRSCASLHACATSGSITSGWSALDHALGRGGAACQARDRTRQGHAPRRHPSSPEHTLYVLDEPTTGLHFEDIRKLMDVLGRLAGAGNTLVVIEHNLDVIKWADWIIDLGPEGGDEGGRVVAAGTPEQVAAVEESHTGLVPAGDAASVLGSHPCNVRFGLAIRASGGVGCERVIRPRVCVGGSRQKQPSNRGECRC